MGEDRETIIQRIINFLYDALDRFQDTVKDLNQSISSLMAGLKKAQSDLSGTGVQRTTVDRSAVLARGPQDSAGSREKLIALLSGKPVTPPPRAAPAAVAAPAARGPPAAGPPAAGPPRGPPAAAAPAAGPPRGPPAAAAPAAGPPRGPPAAGPPAAGPPRGPPAAGPPRGTPAAGPAAGPSAGGQSPAGGAPTISGLRDEMLKELKRLKGIMKGEK